MYVYAVRASKLERATTQYVVTVQQPNIVIHICSAFKQQTLNKCSLNIVTIIISG